MEGITTDVGTKTIMDICDLHNPYCDEKHLSLLLQARMVMQPDITVFPGDFVNLDKVSPHKSRQRPVETEPSYDYEVGNQVLDLLEEAWHSPETVYMDGNHEYWAYTYNCNDGQSKGPQCPLPDKALRLHERGYKYYTYWEQQHGEIYTVGKLGFAHGWYAGDTHAKKMLVATGMNMVYGHDHDDSVFSLVQMKTPRTAWCSGTGIKQKEAKYTRCPNNWRLGFGITYMKFSKNHKENGKFKHYFVSTMDGYFIYNGKEYRA